MSRILNEFSWPPELGDTVWFDGPHGDRIRGEVVRTSSNPDYYHVESGGHRFEVSLNRDKMSTVKDWG